MKPPGARDVLFRQGLDTGDVLPELDIDPRVPLQSLKQPRTTPPMTLAPIPPPELFNLLGRPFCLVVVFRKHPSVVDDVENDGAEETCAADECDEEVACGRDEFVGCVGDGEEGEEVGQEAAPAGGFGADTGWFRGRGFGLRWRGWGCGVGSFPECFTAYNIPERTLRDDRGLDENPALARRDRKSPGRELELDVPGDTCDPCTWRAYEEGEHGARPNEYPTGAKLETQKSKSKSSKWKQPITGSSERICFRSWLGVYWL